MVTISHSMLARILAAIIGGYLFTTVLSLLLFFSLADFQLVDPQTNEISSAALQSIMASAEWSILLSFIIYMLAAMWVFHASNAKRAWVYMLLPSAIGMGLVYMLLPPNLIQSLSSIMELLAVL